MTDLEVRARAAASGLRDAVHRFEPAAAPARPTRRRRNPLVMAGAGLVAIALVTTVVLVWRSDGEGVHTLRSGPGNGITSTRVGGYPIAITVNRQGAFVVNQQPEVVRLDRATGAIAARVPTERMVIGVATDPTLGIWAFGGSDGGDSTGDLVFLGPSTVRPPTTLPVEDGVSALALAAGRVWTMDTAGNLLARDPRTLQVTFQTTIPDTENGTSITATPGALWVATRTSLYRFDLAQSDRSTSLRPASIQLTGSERFQSFASDGRWLWDSVCTDHAGEQCFLERRSRQTGRLLTRDDHRLANRYGAGGSPATGIQAADGSVWAIGADGPTLLRTTPSGTVARILPIPQNLRTDATDGEWRYFGVGAGALWYSVPKHGVIYRIPLP